MKTKTDNLLQKSIILGNNEYQNKNDFKDLFGAWTDEYFKEFEKKVADLNQVNEMDWK